MCLEPSEQSSSSQIRSTCVSTHDDYPRKNSKPRLDAPALVPLPTCAIVAGSPTRRLSVLRLTFVFSNDINRRVGRVPELQFFWLAKSENQTAGTGGDETTFMVYFFHASVICMVDNQRMVRFFWCGVLVGRSSGADYWMLLEWDGEVIARFVLFFGCLW